MTDHPWPRNIITVTALLKLSRKVYHWLQQEAWKRGVPVERLRSHSRLLMRNLPAFSVALDLCDEAFQTLLESQEVRGKP